MVVDIYISTHSINLIVRRNQFINERSYALKKELSNRIVPFYLYSSILKLFSIFSTTLSSVRL